MDSKKVRNSRRRLPSLEHRVTGSVRSTPHSAIAHKTLNSGILLRGSENPDWRELSYSYENELSAPIRRFAEYQALRLDSGVYYHCHIRATPYLWRFRPRHNCQ